MSTTQRPLEAWVVGVVGSASAGAPPSVLFGCFSFDRVCTMQLSFTTAGWSLEVSGLRAALTAARRALGPRRPRSAERVHRGPPAQRERSRSARESRDSTRTERRRTERAGWVVRRFGSDSRPAATPAGAGRCDVLGLEVPLRRDDGSGGENALGEPHAPWSESDGRCVGGATRNGTRVERRRRLDAGRRILARLERQDGRRAGEAKGEQS